MSLEKIISFVYLLQIIYFLFQLLVERKLNQTNILFTIFKSVNRKNILQLKKNQSCSHIYHYKLINLLITKQYYRQICVLTKFYNKLLNHSQLQSISNFVISNNQQSPQQIISEYLETNKSIKSKNTMLSGASSTRNKIIKSNQKSIGQQISTATKFFKKPLGIHDQNQKNYINYLQKIVVNKHTATSKNLQHFNHSAGLSTPISGSLASLKKNITLNQSNKNKKSTVNLSSSSKPIKTLTEIHLTSKEYKDKENKSQEAKQIRSIKKDNSAKNLKLSSGSIQFPKLLTKSISQTTVNKKMDQNRLKMFQKIGMRKKTQKLQKLQKKILQSQQEKQLLNFQKIKINQFKLGKKLGSGRFGNVYIGEEKQTKLIFAIKVMNKIKIKQAEMEEQIVQEIKLQTYMNHPNVLKLYGFFHDAKNIYLILEYCNQCLFRQLRQKGKLSQQQTAYYSKQCISSLKYMHNQNIIHRDIKPENILIQNQVIKMSDFGWSTYAPIYKRQTFCGTVDYVPPEIVQGSSYDQRVDIWATGVLLYELNSGMAPFETKDQNITYEKILKSQCRYPQYFSNSLKNLISKILDKNPSKRPNFDQIQSHLWFQTYKTTGRFIRKDIWAAWNSLA